MPSLTDAVAEFANLQFGKERRMAGQYSEVSLGTGNLQFFDLFANQRALGRDNREFDGAGSHSYAAAPIFLAFSMASSMVPTI